MNKLALLAGTTALALTAFSAAAETMTMTSWTGDKHPFSVNYAEFRDAIQAKTDGRIELELHTGGSLLPVNSALEGVRDGVAQIANNIGAYTPADLPINNLLNDVAFSGTNSIAAGIAMTEMTLTNEAARAEWEKHDVVFVNG